VLIKHKSKKFEDTKGVVRNQKFKDKQQNCGKKLKLKIQNTAQLEHFQNPIEKS
jgi:hypothetical protein